MQTQLLQFPTDLSRNAGRSHRLLSFEDPPYLQHSLQDLASALLSCSNKKETLDTHTLACSYGLEADAQLGPYLIASFAANSCIHYAHQVFNRLTHQTERSWEKLISGCYRRETPREVLSLYRKMQTSAAAQPTIETFIVLLQCCAKLKDLNLGSELHAEVCNAGFLDGNLSVASILVHMYGKCNSLATAQQLLDNLPIRDVVVWTALIYAYSERGLKKDTLRCLEQMKCEGLFPNSFTFASVLKVCVGSGSEIEVWKLHVEIEWHGLIEEDIVIGNTLIDIYGKSGMLQSALLLFDRLPIRNVVSWTTLMSAFVDNEQYEAVIPFYKLMVLEGLSANPVTGVCYLRACGGSGATFEGQAMHIEIEKKGLLEINSFVGSSLVDFYAKVGLLSEAKCVFGIIRAQDSIMWTALIGGCSQHGRNVEALEYFDKMQLSGFLPTVVTFSFALEACKTIGAKDKGKEIHGEIERLGLLGENFVLGNSLIDMYFQFDMPVRAREVFDYLHCRNVVSWNTLITGYAELGQDKIAMHLYEDMDCQQVFPNAITYYCVLKVCARLNDNDMGHTVHLDIEKRGLLEREDVVGPALIEMYGKCGSIDYARLLFDRLHTHDVVSWAALIAGYSQHELVEDVLKCFEQVKLERISPNVTILGCCLKACGDTGTFKSGFEIHAEIERQGLLNVDSGIGNSVVNMYTELGLLDFAQDVVRILSAQNMASAMVSSTEFVEGVCQKERPECKETFECKLFPRYVNSFASNLMAYSNVGVIDEVMHVEIERKGLLENNVYVGNALMGMYTKHGELTKARQVFDTLLVEDVVSWNILISGYVGQGLFEEAFECFKQLKYLGICPDAITYLLLLKVCAKVGDPQTGGSIHAELERQDLIGSNFHIGSALMNMYLKCGSLEKAEQVFNKFIVCNCVLWNVLMDGYAQYGHAEETLKCLEEMQLEGVFPSTATYLCCLKACTIMGAVQEGIELHAESCRMGLLKNPYIGNSLVDMYAKCGHLCMANEVFHGLPDNDVFSFTSLIMGHARFGKSEEILSIFALMLRRLIDPDPTIFLVMLSACKIMGLMDRSLSYFETMTKDHGISPSLEHNLCVIDMFGRAGCIDMAMELISRMPIGPNLKVWDSLLACCRYWGRKDPGKIAFQHALQLDVKDAMAYVLMSHIQGDNDSEIPANAFKPFNT